MFITILRHSLLNAQRMSVLKRNHYEIVSDLIIFSTYCEPSTVIIYLLFYLILTTLKSLTLLCLTLCLHMRQPGDFKYFNVFNEQ